MFNIPGYKKGYVDHTYGGEIDVLPTLLHLMGISTKRYIQFGTDLFSKAHDTVVAFRDQDWVSRKYTCIDDQLYDNHTGKVVQPDKKTKKNGKKRCRQRYEKNSDYQIP